MEWATLLASAILGVIGLIISKKYSRHSKEIADDQMMKELFTEFNRRYDELNDDLEIIHNDYPTTDKLDKATVEGRNISNQLKNKILDFFNLCAEEYYWYYHKKRIDPLVWKSWNEGMNYWYNSTPSIKDMWQREVENGGLASYYITDKIGFFK